MTVPKALKATIVSPPAKGAWIEIPSFCDSSLMPKSPPAKGAWIEIGAWVSRAKMPHLVAPCEGGVD